MYDDTDHHLDSYRDQVATIGKDGKRVWVYPKKPKGKFYNYRNWVTVVYLLIFLILPFIKFKGEPILMFNIIERKVIIFGLLFLPQDYHLLVLTILTFLVFIILFTVIFGRIFCGWVCPQTIFMEMIFRKIEYWIEGDANAQIRLNQGPMTTDKAIKKTTKHIIFYAIAVVVANYFLAYIIGMDQVLAIISEPIGQHMLGFLMMLLFSFVFYGVFSHLREQVCTTICPYGRLQSVLLVPDSIVVAYDFVRGEPRGKIKKPAAAKNLLTAIAETATSTSNSSPLGDCIDCNLCVKVCPTGIDIRNGTQLECVNCTACIDACDEVMEKIDRPLGLIRYDSYNGILNGKQKIFTPRVWAYSAVLSVLLLLDIGLLMNRSDIESTILRSPGQMYQEVDATHTSNLYTFQIANKTRESIPLTLKVKNKKGTLKIVGQEIHPIVAPGEVVNGAFFIILDNEEIEGMKTKIHLEIYGEDKLMDVVTTSFVGPIQ